MAQRRFYFWESYADAFDMLNDAQRGRFIKACYEFAFNGTEPDLDEEGQGMQFAWKLVSGQIEESVAIGVRNSERGRKGGAASHGGGRKKKQAPLKQRSSDMNMNMNVSAGASLEGSAPALEKDGGESDEY